MVSGALRADVAGITAAAGCAPAMANSLSAWDFCQAASSGPPIMATAITPPMKINARSSATAPHSSRNTPKSEPRKPCAVAKALTESAAATSHRVMRSISTGDATPARRRPIGGATLIGQ